MNLKKLPIGIQSFSKIREGNFLYIDKTEVIHRLIDGSGGYYFLTRPHRFGKSLLIGTIAELFRGKKELFNDLWIENNWNWDVKHPVIEIPMNMLGKADDLQTAINDFLNEFARQNELEIKGNNPGQTLYYFIQDLCLKTGQQVVVLIDEYDKPLIDFIDKDEVEIVRKNRSILKGFYGILKPSDQYLKFVLLTGVSKFNQISLFSDLNNLKDISLDRRYTNIVGFTQDEIETGFENHISAACEAMNLSRNGLLAKMKEWYDGYAWDGKTNLYNPFSVLNFLDFQQFENFWFKTGTPTFLMKLLKENFDYRLENKTATVEELDAHDIDSLQILPLLFQTGYLTIKNIDEYGIYHLDYPNREVHASFLTHLVNTFSERKQAKAGTDVINIKRAFDKNDLQTIFDILHSLFQSIPHQLFTARTEGYFHALVHLTFSLLGVYTQSEVSTAKGRADVIVHTQTHIYGIEFKLNDTKEAALQQVLDRDYLGKYKNSGKQLVAVGVKFSLQARGIEGFLSYEL